jgi:hypothetical protein
MTLEKNIIEKKCNKNEVISENLKDKDNQRNDLGPIENRNKK